MDHPEQREVGRVEGPRIGVGASNVGVRAWEPNLAQVGFDLVIGGQEPERWRER